MTKTGRNKVARGNQMDEIEGYLDQLGLRLGRDYSSNQRIVFIAALAERHLAAYEASPQAGREQVAILREVMQAVWSHVQGHHLPVYELERLRRQVSASEISASMPQHFVNLAVESCVAPDNLLVAQKAARADYEAVLQPLPGYPDNLTARKKVWRQPDVVAAIDHQQALLMHAHMPVINEVMVDFLKRDARAEKPFRVQSSYFLLPTHPDEPAKAEAGLPVLDLSGLMGSVPPGSILDQLASMIGKLQKGIPADELLKRAAEAGAEKSGFVRSKTEKEHDQRLEAAMTPWKNEQRIAFCAALCEQWLPEYEAFANGEGWGHPDLLRRSLDAVWAHLQGRRLSRSTGERYRRQMIENAPDTEEFDAPLAMAACEILDHTLASCLESDNLGYAISAGMAGCSYRAMLGQGRDYRGDDPDEEEQLWQQPSVQQEIARQAALLAKIAPLASFDTTVVEALRFTPNRSS